MSATGWAVACARKDLRRYLADPLAMLLWIGIPLLIGGLITLLMGVQGGPTPEARLLVVDGDDSFVSGALLQIMGGAYVVVVETTEEAEGRRELDDGEASGLLFIPEDFGEDWLEDRPTELVLLTNPAQRILPGILREMLEVFVDGSFYLQRVAGDEMRDVTEGPLEDEDVLPDAQVAATAVRINGVVRRIEKYLFPPAIELEVVVREDGPETGSGEDEATAPVDGDAGEVAEAEPEPDHATSLLFLPGAIVMALFFIAQGLSEDLWKERELGTLARARTAPGGMAAFLVGKAAAACMVVAGLGGAGARRRLRLPRPRPGHVPPRPRVDRPVGPRPVGVDGPDAGARDQQAGGLDPDERRALPAVDGGRFLLSERGPARHPAPHRGCHPERLDGRAPQGRVPRALDRGRARLRGRPRPGRGPWSVAGSACVA